MSANRRLFKGLGAQGGTSNNCVLDGNGGENGYFWSSGQNIIRLRTSLKIRDDF